MMMDRTEGAELEMKKSQRLRDVVGNKSYSGFLWMWQVRNRNQG